MIQRNLKMNNASKQEEMTYMGKTQQVRFSGHCKSIGAQYGFECWISMLLYPYRRAIDHVPRIEMRNRVIK